MTTVAYYRSWSKRAETSAHVFGKNPSAEPVRVPTSEVIQKLPREAEPTPKRTYAAVT
jgi:hypothetical protein